VVVQGGEWSGGRSTFAMDLPLGDTVVAVTDDGRRSLAEFVGQTVHAMAGIGHPQRFFGALRQAGLRVVEHPFPDHYDYRPEDLRFAADGVLLMTEKDAVKCARFPLRNAWFVPVSAQVDPELEAKVLTWVRQRGRDLRQG